MKQSILSQKGISEDFAELIANLVARIPWPTRRSAMGQVALVLLDGKPRLAETVFGWNRQNVQLGIHEFQSGVECLNDLSARRKPKIEEKHPQLITDIHEIMTPHAEADTQLRTTLMHSDMTAQRVHDALQQKGWSPEALPTVRTLSNLLNRLEYRRRTVAKTKVQKKRLKPRQFSPTSGRSTRKPMRNRTL